MLALFRASGSLPGSTNIPWNKHGSKVGFLWKETQEMTNSWFYAGQFLAIRIVFESLKYPCLKTKDQKVFFYVWSYVLVMIWPLFESKLQLKGLENYLALNSPTFHRRWCKRRSDIYDVTSAVVPNHYTGHSLRSLQIADNHTVTDVKQPYISLAYDKICIDFIDSIPWNYTHSWDDQCEN